MGSGRMDKLVKVNVKMTKHVNLGKLSGVIVEDNDPKNTGRAVKSYFQVQSAEGILSSMEWCL